MMWRERQDPSAATPTRLQGDDEMCSSPGPVQPPELLVFPVPSNRSTFGGNSQEIRVEKIALLLEVYCMFKIVESFTLEEAFKH